MNPSNYDYLIVGAGIAGLHCALRISKAKPNARIGIAESYTQVGGRMSTYKNPSKHVQWESGAGRVHSSHKLTLNYAKDYGITLFPIPSHTVWRSKDGESKDLWPSLSAILTSFLSTLRPAVLATHTIYQLLETIYGTSEAERVLAYFPYSAEVRVMRADLAIQSIQREMGSNSNFFVAKEGWGELAERMADELDDRGVEFLFQHRLVGLGSEGLGGVLLKFQVNTSDDTKELIQLHAKKAILTLPSRALKTVYPFQNLPVLKHIVMCPLLRTYAVFPTEQKTSWFSNIPKTVTDSPIRYFIPIDASKGIAMVSYTDASDTEIWTRILKKKGEAALGKAILKSLRDLFPRSTIPEPTFFKAHEWKQGCSYWTPGMYSPQEKSIQCMNPLPSRWPDLFMCGESYSLRQAWIEGSLEHAEELFVRYAPRIL